MSTAPILSILRLGLILINLAVPAIFSTDYFIFLDIYNMYGPFDHYLKILDSLFLLCLCFTD